MSLPSPQQWLTHFRLDAFRPGQQSVIEAVLSGQDTLCVMPTGGGKSLCYQLPTIARAGVTIVISPLIALMQDQVESLNRVDIPATFINSTLTPGEQLERIHNMVAGVYQLVYVAPERLRSNAFIRAVQNTPIQLLAVDEAHCISQWGHDFRPDYARLGRFRTRLGNPQTVALTATATPLVQEDIVRTLELKQPAVFVTGFARKNLHINIESPNSNSEKDTRLIEFLNITPGSGIIYASTRKNCEHLVELLHQETNRSLAFYHAGMMPDDRRQVQQLFMSGKTDVIVATNAFGMGIDKANLRFVVHYNIPGSIEAYYQEAGRAGRDGLPSKCLLLYSFQDKFIQEFFIENAYPSVDMVEEIYEYLRQFDADPIEMTLQDIKDELGLSLGTSGIGNCENLLEKANAIERLDSAQNSAAIRIDSELPTLVDLLPRQASTQRKVLRRLESYCDSFRGERVLFSPQKLAQSLDMKWEAVANAIRQICKLPMVDYIPPFRGRAIHVVDRKKTFNQLPIDFDELNRRKNAEYEKLERMIRFATTYRCRQLEILEYFGDPDQKNCSNCDNCDLRGTQVGKYDQDACLYGVQVALSGIARTHGRLGKTLIALMLTGSESKKIKQLYLNRLSTFGLLKNLRQPDVVGMIEFLVEQGFANQSESVKFRPTVQIADRGWKLMRGEMQIDICQLLPSELATALSQHLRGKLPIRGGNGDTALPDQVNESTLPLELPESAPIGEFTEFDEAAEFSKDLHDELSDDGNPLQSGVPERRTPRESKSIELVDHSVVQIKTDDLEPLSGKNRPFRTRQDPQCDLNPIYPHSDHKTPSNNRNSLISSCEPRTGKSNSPTRSVQWSQQQNDLPPSDQTVPSWWWSWRLLADHYSLDHIQKIRNLDRETVLDHLCRAASNGHLIDLESLFSNGAVVRMSEFCRENAALSTGAMINKLPSDFTPGELMLFLQTQPLPSKNH